MSITPKKSFRKTNCFGSKSFFESQKKGGLVVFERRSRMKIMNNRLAAHGVVHVEEDGFAEVDVKKAAEDFKK